MDPVVESALVTPDGYWRVEVVRYGHRNCWYRVWHAKTVVADKVVLGTVQRILGDEFELLRPLEDDAAGTVA